MKRLWFAALMLGVSASAGRAADFDPPIRLKGGDTAIRVEAPGYACPGWADLQGNGKKQLLVGQFNKGKIQVCDHLGGSKFGPSRWLQVDGKFAEIPGIW